MWQFNSAYRLGLPMHSGIININNRYHEQHPFHLVNISARPFFVSWGLFFCVLALLAIMHPTNNFYLPTPFLHSVYWPLALLTYHVYAWFSDILNESEKSKAHTELVQRGLATGMILFIASEVMFFFAFFWAIFHFSVSPAISVGAVWPSTGLQTIDPFGVPLLNTLLLLASGVTLTFAHRYLTNIANKETKIILEFICSLPKMLVTPSKKEFFAHFMAQIMLTLTIILGVIFLLCQAYEYVNAPYTILNGAYPSIFFLSTGFHGFHVLCGTIFLIICLSLLTKKYYTATRHLSFEFAAWYWHFVDVVWILLYICLYCLSPLI